MRFLLLLSTFLLIVAAIPRRGFVYNVPRPGIIAEEDCFTAAFNTDHSRDFKIMKSVGADFIIANCRYDLYKNHQAMLHELANNNLQMLIPIDLNISVAAWKEWIEVLDERLQQKAVAGVIFKIYDDIMKLDISEFVHKINDLKFFQQFLSERANLQTWVDISYTHQGVRPLIGLLRTIEERLPITGWSITAFCKKDLIDWMESTLTKPMMVQIGADDWDTKQAVATPDLQQKQLELLWNTTLLDPRITNVAINSFANTYDSGDESADKFSSRMDVCPDPNPYILTTCGLTVKDIDFGDNIVSVEMLGAFLPYETLWMARCLVPKGIDFQTLWGTGSLIGVEYCTFSISVHLYIIFGVGAMLVLVIACTMVTLVRIHQAAA